VKLSPKQQSHFWLIWAEVCSVQGWLGAEKEVHRKEVLAECGFRSLKDVDKTAGFDRLKGALNRLRYRLEGGTEAAFPDTAEARRHAWLIGHKLIPALAADLGGQDKAEAYVAKIIRDRWDSDLHWSQLGLHLDPRRSPEMLRHLLFTLSRVLHRRDALPDDAPAQAVQVAQNLDKPLIDPPSEASFGQTSPVEATPSDHPF
jgi:hypothetical protein